MGPIELTLEQQLQLRVVKDKVEKMSLDQSKEFLVELYRQMMIRETMYKNFLKHEWGIDALSIKFPGGGHE